MNIIDRKNTLVIFLLISLNVYSFNLKFNKDSLQKNESTRKIKLLSSLCVANSKVLFLNNEKELNKEWYSDYFFYNPRFEIQIINPKNWGFGISFLRYNFTWYGPKTQVYQYYAIDSGFYVKSNSSTIRIFNGYLIKEQPISNRASFIYQFATGCLQSSSDIITELKNIKTKNYIQNSSINYYDYTNSKIIKATCGLNLKFEYKFNKKISAFTSVESISILSRKSNKFLYFNHKNEKVIFYNFNIGIALVKI